MINYDNEGIFLMDEELTLDDLSTEMSEKHVISIDNEYCLSVLDEEVCLSADF